MAQDKEENGASTAVQIHIYAQATEYPVGTDGQKMGMNGGLLRTAITCLTAPCLEILLTMQIEDLHHEELTMAILARHYHIMTTFHHGHRWELTIEEKGLQVLHLIEKTEDRLDMTSHVLQVVVAAAAAAATSTHTFPHTRLPKPTKGVRPGGIGTANNRRDVMTGSGTATEIEIEGETRMTAVFLILVHLHWGFMNLVSSCIPGR